MRRVLLGGAWSAGGRLLPSALCLLLSASLALTPAQEARAEHLGRNLRCPICTGVPITESTNDISREMLREVREQVAAGRSDRQIYDYFAARYGNFVLLDPPKEGAGMLLWGAPLAALVAGGAVLWGFLGRRRAAVAANPAAVPTPDEPFDTYLAEVQRQTRPKRPQREGDQA
ncbi:cytochrome C biogenesis protein [Deinococcus geothermalis DSM 11300]|uniref:Cytochrome c-type biogenesis protein n=1 Tax=Deinococcus geothermalis (strain DSM 11300 / CIP 105573 / AG-3a) TaxID=319795 RepID=Q1IYY9_DEIGD|nr:MULTISPECIES: cytochrome c-type biogenesis protein [Deinococcus]ABF45545.1 cytochrome C biogenesis protein [Deinococcus geothermalis DSM 11300]